MAGSWSAIGEGIAGPWLGTLVVLASVLGNAGLFMAEIFEDAWQLFGMAECHLAPRFFARRHPRFGTPVNALCVGFVGCAVLLMFDFYSILVVDNFFSCTPPVPTRPAAPSLQPAFPPPPVPTVALH